MTKQELMTFKREHSLTFEQLATLCGVTKSAAEHWCYGVRSIPGSVQVLVRLYKERPANMKSILPEF